MILLEGLIGDGQEVVKEVRMVKVEMTGIGTGTETGTGTGTGRETERRTVAVTVKAADSGIVAVMIAILEVIGRTGVEGTIEVEDHIGKKEEKLKMH
jgi:hypothetical protein